MLRSAGSFAAWPACCARPLRLQLTACPPRCAAVCGSIARADVADLVVKALVSGTASKVVLSAVDSEQVFGAPQYETYKL
jgi:hypothetical protein